MRRKRICVPIDERFWSHVNKTDTCWLWTKSTNNSGYGRFQLNRQTCVRAHRFAWELANGQPVPKGLWVLHKCDNPICVNPDHLYVGTQQQNEQDKSERGGCRNRFTPVPKHGLNAESVLAITLDPRSSYKVAADYGVGPSTIQCVRDGRTWANITGITRLKTSGSKSGK